MKKNGTHLNANINFHKISDVFQLMTISNCFRLAPTLQQTQLSQNIPSGTGTLQSAGPQQSNLVMPVFPLRPPPQSTTSHYSPYSPSRFHIDKRCQHRCSWKCLSIGLIMLAVVLSAMLAYFAGKYELQIVLGFLLRSSLNNMSET